MPTTKEALEALDRITAGLSIEELVAADIRVITAHIESAGADAERYRWLRAKENANHDAWNTFGPYSSEKEIDAAIDAARTKESQDGN